MFGVPDDLGHVEPALAAFDEALRLDSENANAYAYRGLARFSQGQLDSARADIYRALELEPANPVAKAAMAKLVFQTRRR